jgi:enoyl-[acyl-carrier protein] reductase II
MTKINALLHTEFPFIQGGMANIATGAFAAAASNAGGLGLIASGGMDAEALRREVRACKAFTNKPFGLNLMLMNPDADRIAAMAVEEGIPVITTGAGNPGRYMAAWKAAGMAVLPVVSSVVLARRLAAAGADAIIAEGMESGGHVGDITTMALVPQVADAVDIPVVAAGGIADGRQLLAAYALGAAGVQLGTCLLASEECPIHDNYKQAILKAGDRSTVVTGTSVGAPVRILKNKMARTYLKKEAEGADKMALEAYTLGSLRRAVLEGDVENGSLMAGQVCGMITAIRPLRQIFEDLAAEADDVLKGLMRP